MTETRELIDAVLTASNEENGKKKLACADAFELTKKFDVEIIEIGRICNHQNIKICKCQLGCFK